MPCQLIFSDDININYNLLGGITVDIEALQTMGGIVIIILL